MYCILGKSSDSVGAPSFEIAGRFSTGINSYSSVNFFYILLLPSYFDPEKQAPWFSVSGTCFPYNMSFYKIKLRL